MEANSILYTEGHRVTVKPHDLMVGRRHYYFDTPADFEEVHMRKTIIPGLILMLLGLIGLVLGIFHLVPADLFSVSSASAAPAVGGTVLDGSIMAILLGGLFLAGGLVWLALAHDRWAVHFNSRYGQKNVVVSSHKAYIDEIIRSMKRAVKF